MHPSFIFFCNTIHSPEGSDSGVNINDIIGNLSNKGFSANDIRNAINHLSNEGHIYSTIDENHYQYAC